MIPSEYLDRFYKKSITGKSGNIFIRLEALEELVSALSRSLQSGGNLTQNIQNIIYENREIILSSVAGGTTDPTDAAFTGVVISPSGQTIGGVLYNFALVEDGVVITGWGDDGGTVIVGGGDVFGDTVPSVADHVATFTDTTGKHIKDGGVRIVGNSNGIGIGPNTVETAAAGNIIGLGDGAAQTSVGGNVIGIGLLAANDSQADNVIGIGANAAAVTEGENVIGIGSSAAAATVGDDLIALGRSALQASSGSRNIGLGANAGRYETGSDKFFIDMYDRTNEAGGRAGAIIYGVMNADPALQELTFNANVTVNGDLTVTGSGGGGGGSLAQILAVSSIGI